MAYGLDVLADPGLSWSAGDDALFGGPYSDVLSRFATLESGGGQYRSNPMSNARGLLHFMPDTWKGVLRNYPDLGFTPEDIDSDEKQKRAAEVMMEREIVPALRRTLGRDPNGAELYTAWVLGTPDAQKLFGADPNAPASALFRPKVASSNPTIFYRDEEAMIPRTVAEVKAEYARRWSGAKPMKEPPQMAQQPEYDIDQGLANMGRMAERVGQMQPNMPMPQGGGNQPFGLNPYLYLAAQLMPQRKGGGWADAAMAAGAAMMQSNRPDFLGGVGAGLQAANQSMARDEEQRYRDQVGTLDLGLKMAQLGQKEAKQPLIKEFKEGDRIVTKQWNGAMWVPLADAPANAPPPGFTRGPDGGLVGDPAYLAAQEQIRRAGKTEVTNTVDMKGQTAGAQEAAKLDAKKLDGFRSQGDTAASTIDDINMVESWLSGLDTGTLAPEKLAAQKFLGGLGINLNIFGTQEQVGKAEAATTIVNQMALKLRNPESGLGMPGAMSDKDLAFLKQSVVGLETGPIGRKLIIDLTRRAANRRMEVARLADEYYYQNDNSFKGWSAYLKEWRNANPLFSEADVEAAKAAKAAATTGGATAPPPAERELPPSDADIRRQQQQQPPAQPQSGGGGLPMPKRFDLGGPKVGAQPQGDIPTFTDPNDPALAKLPSGSVFRDGSGTLRYKP